MLKSLLLGAGFLMVGQWASANTSILDLECHRRTFLSGDTIADTLHKLTAFNGEPSDQPYGGIQNQTKVPFIVFVRAKPDGLYKLNEMEDVKMPKDVTAKQVDAVAQFLLTELNGVKHAQNRTFFDLVNVADVNCGTNVTQDGHEGQSECLIDLQVNCGVKSPIGKNK